MNPAAAATAVTPPPMPRPPARERGGAVALLQRDVCGQDVPPWTLPWKLSLRGWCVSASKPPPFPPTSTASAGNRGTLGRRLLSTFAWTSPQRCSERDLRRGLAGPGASSVTGAASPPSVYCSAASAVVRCGSPWTERNSRFEYTSAPRRGDGGLTCAISPSSSGACNETGP